MKGGRIEELTEQVRLLSLQVQGLQRVLRRSVEQSSLQGPLDDYEFVDFEVGDRVCLLNEIRKPASWDSRKPWIVSEARGATVTRVRGQQVFLLTDNGVSTWRKVKNLRTDD